MVKLLLDNSTDISAEINATDCLGMTPLFLAAKGGSAEVAAALLEKGADVKKRTLVRCFRAAFKGFPSATLTAARC